MQSLMKTVGLLTMLLLYTAPIYSCLILLYLLIFTNFYWVTPLYAAWLYYDRNTPYTGSKSNKFVRGWFMWDHFRKYFPAKLVKTAELNAKTNYIFCTFPHGLCSFGATAVFGVDSAGFPKLYPGLTPHVVTVRLFFSFPICRDVIRFAGYIPSSERSLDYVLSRPEGGHAAVLVVGGAAEAALSRPNSYKVIVKRRKGFIRLAFKHGVPLVPVISFGENDIYEQTVFPEGSWMRWFQDMIHKKTGVFPAIPMGRFFLIPYQRPITVVVGKPLEVEKVAQPTPQQMEEVKEKFIKSLVQLFEEHKHKYVKDPENTFMEIL